MQTGTNPSITPGLEGVVAAETRLSSVNGQIGELIIAGFAVEAFLLSDDSAYMTGQTLVVEGGSVVR